MAGRLEVVAALPDHTINSDLFGSQFVTTRRGWETATTIIRYEILDGVYGPLIKNRGDVKRAYSHKKKGRNNVGYSGWELRCT